MKLIKRNFRKLSVLGKFICKCEVQTLQKNVCFLKRHVVRLCIYIHFYEQRTRYADGDDYEVHESQ